ncbi:YfdX protein (plasmid) [Cylindrospermum stagnale PCC 7417]|uniref:YfdX protein n=1 Tax=Cylindrospermum stagnale PCC 7417 TaxID=56107 RepID=K9XA08_9NOST|nr:YfdX family protein [Cylindrospermum stagnale]AFZ28477.1 YfdX protein [Cylindrospermum stagnale PCC 7417]
MNSQTLNQPDIRLQQEIDKETKKATDEAERCLDREAVSAIEETRNAINAIEEENTQEAIAALERATGKLDILVARYPELGLVPVMTQVSIINVAPLDLHVIERIRTQLKNAFNNEDFPTARQLLNNLMSEIRTLIVNLPLETYPDAMREAARLLSEGKTDAARTLLQVALSTLVLTEQSRPIPLLNAYTLLVDAVDLAESDPEQTLRLLKDARTQLKLAQELGYARSNPEYAELEQAIKNLERQVKASEKTTDAFAKLQERFSSFFNKVSAAINPA